MGLPQVANRDMSIPKREGDDAEDSGDSYLFSCHVRAYELAIQASFLRLQESTEVSCFRASVTFEG